MKKIYYSHELSNDAYHSDQFPQSSGSELAIIHADCPAALRYGKKKETAAMSAGTAGHACLLESEKFNASFARGINPSDYEGALVTGKDLEGWLRDSGRKGYSNKRKAELIEMIHQSGETPLILDVIVLEHEFACKEKNQTIVPFDVYDSIKKMRDVIFQNDHDNLLTGGHNEVSLINEDLDLKCRIDLMGQYIDSNDGYNGPVIVDYKTTTSAHPENFGAQALRMNYWLKMAIQHDLYLDHFGVSPRVILFAQSKNEPYLCKPYVMTDEQLDVGREQYQQAKRLHDRCKASDSWPAYGRGTSELITPSWAARMYSIE